MKPEDRLLHYALKRTLGRIPDADLTQRIVSAWERGESGTGTLPGPKGPRARPAARGSDPARRGPARWVPAAAAALIAAAGLGWWTTRPGSEPASGPGPLAEAPPAEGQRASAPSHAADPAPSTPSNHSTHSNRAGVLARASAPLQRFGAPSALLEEPASTELRELVAGQRVLVPRGAPVSLELAAGEVLTAWPGTVFSLAAGAAGAAGEGAGARVLLEAGTLRMATPAAPSAIETEISVPATAAIDAGFAALEPEPGSLVLAHVESDDPDAPIRDPGELARLMDQDGDLARLFSVEVTAGAARVATADGERTLLERASTAVSSVPEDASLAAVDRAWIDERLFQVSRAEEGLAAAGATTGRNLAADTGERAEAELYEYLDERPTRWILLYEVALDSLERQPRWYGRDVLATIVATPHPRAFATVRALWRERPDAFGPNELVALAERGGFEFERELRARVETWSPGEDLPVIAAAWLARSGDGRGRAVLLEGAALPIEGPESVLARMQASLGLEALGNQQAVELTLEAIARGGLAALDGGKLDLARGMAGAVDLSASRRAEGQALPLIGFSDEVDGYVLEQGDRFADAVSLRALLEGFLPN